MPYPKPHLPDRLYFKIGEVASIVGVKPHVLRYWESEFSFVKPSKTRAQHRLYRRKDVENLLLIKRLLHDERFTIDGARKRLRTLLKEGRQAPESAPVDRSYRTILAQVKKDIQALHRLVSGAPTTPRALSRM